MSWFNTFKNVAKVVANNLIPPTPAGIAGGCNLGSAVPTVHDGFWSSLSNAASSSSVYAVSDESESDNEGQAEASQSTRGVTTRARYTYELDRERPGTSRSNDSDSDEAAPRITTRARVTYELDRFQKNALLMFVQNRSDVSTDARVEKSTTQDMNAILDTFTGFRFEITPHIDLTCGEIDNKCQEFFQQNFQEFGAIVVVVLTFEGITGQLSAIDGRFSESIIMRHITNDLNPTLQAKPRIYITEANRVAPENGSGYSIPIDEHPDVLCLHLPTIDYGIMTDRPLLILCKQINKMADTQDFVTVLEKSVRDIQMKIVVSLRIEDKPVELKHNFTKEMMLARS